MNSLLQDIRYAARMLARNPGFTVVAVLTLALGIGATTAMFTVVHSLLLQPLPYSEADELVNVYRTIDSRPGSLRRLSLRNYIDWNDQSGSYSQIGLYSTTRFTVTGGPEPEILRGSKVSPNIFDILRIRPAYGRSFAPDEGEPGKNRVVLLSYDFWQSRFGGGDIIGKTLRINDEPYAIIGAMPQLAAPFEKENFLLPWTPKPEGFYSSRRANGPYILARLNSGATLKSAQTESDTIGQRLAEAYPEDNEGQGIRLMYVHEDTVRWIRTRLLVLMGAVCMVLLIACANVANLLLARAQARQQEVAVRAALGAGRGRLVRQFLTESVILTSMGSVLGLFFAWAAVRLAVPRFPPYVPRVDEIGLDWRIVVFAAGVALLLGVLAGLFPALTASRPNLVEILKESRGANTAGGNRVRNVLTVLEVCLAMLLLTGSGLMVNSFLRLQNVKPGVDTTNLLSFSLSFPERRFPALSQRLEFVRRMHQHLKSLPGVTDTAVTSAAPLSDRFFVSRAVAGTVRPEGQGSWQDIAPVPVDGSHFRFLNIPLLKGRYINEEDNEASRPVAVVDEDVARDFWPDQDPVGQYMFFSHDQEPREIVGVVGKAKYSKPQRRWQPVVYIPYQQSRFVQQMSFMVRTTSEPTLLIPMIKNQVWALDPDLPVSGIRTTEDQYDRWLAEPRFYTGIFTLFSGLAVLVAAVGLYGVIAYSVGRRTHEIGIRMALGAQRGNVLRMVLRQGMTLTAIGIAAGLVVSYWLTKYLKSFLFEVEPTDPLTFAVVAALLGAVAFAACWIPARRATRVDPMTALRYE